MQKLLEEALSEYRSKKILLKVIRPISSGKEADVYLVEKGNELLALKVYKNHLTRSFQQNALYISGKHFRANSERKAVGKKTRFGKNLLHKAWVKREFYLLKKLHNIEISVPKPYELSLNSILMEYIGDLHYPAPKLKDVTLNTKQAKEVHDKILKDIETMYANGIVHGDLSEFNILYWDNKPYIIDYPQAVDIRTNPNAQDLLKKDKQNIINWYDKKRKP